MKLSCRSWMVFAACLLLVAAAVAMIGVADRGWAGATPPAEEIPRFAEVAVMITPGKPGAPTEQIVATRNDSSYQLQISRAHDDGESVNKEEEKVVITSRDFATVWSLVVEQDLTRFNPSPRSGQVFDFGQRQMKIHQRSEKASVAHEASWNTSLKNDREVATLFRALADLAKKKGELVRLHYFENR